MSTITFRGKKMKKYLFYHVSIPLISVILLVQPVIASDKTYTFSIVPQHSAIKTTNTWGPLLQYISKETGVNLSLRTNKNISDFEQSLKNESHDFS
jgi:ABC-type phosphate/phosphonate transport system substrate-binding protein